MSEIEMAAGNVKAAMKAAEAGSSDLWMVPLANIRVLEGFNVRTENADYATHICEIGESILANGYRKDKPLAGYVALEGDQHIIYLTDGHSRLRAVEYANSKGANIEKLPVVTAPAGTSMEDLTIGLVTSNSGKQLSPIEKAAVCKRLIGYGMEEGEIAKRLGFSAGYVGDLLLLSGCSKKVRTMVESGEVSAGNAIEAVKKHGAKAADFLGEKLTQAQAAGKGKVTARTLKPKRDLVAEGVDWIGKNGGDARPQLVALLAFVTGAEQAAIESKLGA